ncbi:MAG: hypothetical protein ACRD5K_13445, partial [Candidatus Acidiferrales bacterium]
CAAPIDSLREGPPHLGTHAAHAPSFLSAFSRDHTLRSEFLPNVGVISLAVELGAGQHQADACLLGCRLGLDASAFANCGQVHEPRACV